MRSMTETQYHAMPDGRRIAFRLTQGAGPTLVFLPGYMSDMSGSKATALFEDCANKGRACLLLDYSGCGQSEGEFADGTLSRWCEEVCSLIDAYASGQILLVGSSMGGWLMLLVGLALGKRLAGIIGIAPAPDFTSWGYSSEQQSALIAGETIYEDNPYGPEPTPTYPGLYKDAQAQLQLGGPIAIACPVTLLHGQRDEDVPWDISLKLAAALGTPDVQVTLVKDGDHRLSRPGDIALLKQSVDALFAKISSTP